PSERHRCAYTPLLLPPPPTPRRSTLSLHDALPIWRPERAADPARGVGHDQRVDAQASEHAHRQRRDGGGVAFIQMNAAALDEHRDRKSSRLNSSHVSISYAVFCLKKKKNKKHLTAE